VFSVLKQKKGRKKIYKNLVIGNDVIERAPKNKWKAIFKERAY